MEPITIAGHFLKAYFSTLASNPADLVELYGTDAKYTRDGETTEGDEKILEKILEVGYDECKTSITTYAVQKMSDNSILVNLLAAQQQNAQIREFSQTFVLGAHGEGYMILHDIILTTKVYQLAEQHFSEAPEVEAAPEPEPEPEPVPEPVVEAQPEPEPEPEVVAPEVKAAPEPEPAEETVVEAQPQPEPEPVQEPVVEAQPEPEPVQEPVVEAPAEVVPRKTFAQMLRGNTTPAKAPEVKSPAPAPAVETTETAAPAKTAPPSKAKGNSKRTNTKNGGGWKNARNNKRDQKEKRPTYRKDGNADDDPANVAMTLFVKPPQGCTVEDLTSIFQAFGEMRITQNNQRGFCFVHYTTQQAFQSALSAKHIHDGIEFSVDRRRLPGPARNGNRFRNRGANNEAAEGESAAGRGGKNERGRGRGRGGRSRGRGGNRGKSASNRPRDSN
jgi:hypothetical protein